MLKLVISTPDNVERAQNVRMQMESQGITDYLLVPAEMMPKHPPMGISRSFKKCIRIAKEAALPHVLIFEDDVLFLTPTSFHNFKAAFVGVPEDWDLMLGGIYDGTPVPVNERVAKVEDKLSGLHCIIVNSKCYDSILNADENANLDWVLSEQLRLNIYTMYPMGILQRDGIYSYNARQVTQYNAHLHKRYKLLTE